VGLLPEQLQKVVDFPLNEALVRKKSEPYLQEPPVGPCRVALAKLDAVFLYAGFDIVEIASLLLLGSSAHQPYPVAPHVVVLVVLLQQPLEELQLFCDSLLGLERLAVVPQLVLLRILAEEVVDQLDFLV